MTYSNNKTDNSGTPLTVDDNTVEGVTTAVSDANDAHKEQKDNDTTITASNDCTTPKAKDCSTHRKPSKYYVSVQFLREDNFRGIQQLFATTHYGTHYGTSKGCPRVLVQNLCKFQTVTSVRFVVVCRHSTASRHCSSSRPMTIHIAKARRCTPLFFLHTATRTTPLYQTASPPRQHHFRSVRAICL